MSSGGGIGRREEVEGGRVAIRDEVEPPREVGADVPLLCATTRSGEFPPGRRECDVGAGAGRACVSGCPSVSMFGLA